MNLSDAEKKYKFLPEILRKKFLGIISNTEIQEPLPVPLFSGISEIRVAHVSVGLGHVIAITKSGTAYSWGNNERG